MFEFAKLARQAGFPLNAFVTIKADKRCSTDQERKRDLSRKIAHLGQAIKGRGRTPRQAHFVGVTTYEKKRSGVLHAHVLVHVENFAFARQWADGDVTDVIRARADHLDYITKQRLPLSPDFEATLGHRRQPSEKIAGVRLSFSADAKALITAQRSEAIGQGFRSAFKVVCGKPRCIKRPAPTLRQSLRRPRTSEEQA